MEMDNGLIALALFETGSHGCTLIPLQGYLFWVQVAITPHKD